MKPHRVSWLPTSADALAEAAWLSIMHGKKKHSSSDWAWTWNSLETLWFGVFLHPHCMCSFQGSEPGIQMGRVRGVGLLPICIILLSSWRFWVLCLVRDSYDFLHLGLSVIFQTSFVNSWVMRMVILCPLSLTLTPDLSTSILAHCIPQFLLVTHAPKNLSTINVLKLKGSLLFKCETKIHEKNILQ